MVLFGWPFDRLAQAVNLKAIKLLVKSTTMAHSPMVVQIAELQRQSPDFDPAPFVVLPSDGKPSEIAFETDRPAPERRVVTLEYGPEAAIAPLRTGRYAVLAGGDQEAPDAHPLSRTSVLAAMRRACDYQIAAQAGTHDNGWVRSTFYAGVMALYQTTHEQRYLDAALRWANASQWTPARRNPVNADNQCCIQTYAELAMQQKDTTHLAPVLAAYAQQMAAPKSGREQWWWCDSLFMAPAGMVRVSAATGDPRYTALMNSLWWDTTDFLYDKDAHLFYRDKSFFSAKTAGGKKVFWSRGNGWVMGGLVRVLEYLPEKDPNRRRFLQLHQEMSAKIASLQGEDGLWRPSLLDPQQFPSPETSGTGFFTYALAWGINHRTLDRRTYLPVVQKAWIGLVSKLGPDGRLGYVQGVAGAPGPVKPEHTEEYAVGALLLAGCEMVKLVR